MIYTSVSNEDWIRWRCHCETFFGDKDERRNIECRGERPASAGCGRKLSNVKNRTTATLLHAMVLPVFTRLHTCRNSRILFYIWGSGSVHETIQPSSTMREDNQFRRRADKAIEHRMLCIYIVRPRALMVDEQCSRYGERHFQLRGHVGRNSSVPHSTGRRVRIDR